MTMEEFSAESGAGLGPLNTVTLASVLDRALPISWDEAVALVQEVIDIVTAESRDDIPRFEDLSIDPTGAITVEGTRRGERGPVAAGRALHTLLASADVPLALRLFVTQANAPETHASMRAFADGLAYFGKPGRSDLIRAVYERYKAAAATQPAPSPSPRPLPPPLPSLTPMTPRRPKRVLPRWVPIAIIGACVVSAAAVAWFGVIGKSSAKSNASTPATPSTNGKVAASAQKAGSSRSNPTPAKPAIARTSTSAVRAATSRTVSSGNVAAKAIAANISGVDGPLFAPEPPVQPSTSPFVLDPLPSRTDSSVDASLPHSAKQDDPTAIYSVENTEVKPPVMLYPQLPPPLLIGTPAEALVNRMELLVATDGSVERVRLVNTPRRMADMMLLSGAKLWRFTPALKDGAPVRYRTIVSWTVFP